ncbi:MAG: hypothetical protein EPN22_15410 [Nitrospirae bacterium]|nr:MAG: hypothetical protein EPN22_15410 [Nitrospirota bacterium]
MLRKILAVVAASLIVSSLAFAEQGTFRSGILPAPPQLSAKVQFYEPSGNNILDAEEAGKLIITIKNSGRGDAYDLKAELQPERSVSGLYFDRTLNIGTVSAGATVTKEVELRASEDIHEARVSVLVDIREANGFDPNPVRIAFETKAFQPPKLIIADMGIEDQNQNYKIEPQEITAITARIQNTGYGEARDVVADVRVGQNVFIEGESKTHFELGPIPAGQFRDIKFSFYTNNRIKNGENIPISIDVRERRPKFGLSEPLKLAMNAPQKSIDEVEVKGERGDQKPQIEIASDLSIDVDKNLPEGEKAGKYDVAVVVGNRNYAASGLTDVEFADRDAAIMKEYLIKTFGFDPRNIIFEKNATFTRFTEIFGSDRDHKGDLFRYVKEGASKVFIYYSGHGAPDLDSKEAYFVPVDAKAQNLALTGYRLQTFYNNLSKLPAQKVTIVLDACFSGNSERGIIFKDANISPGILKVKKEFEAPQNALLITSAGVDQVSTWFPAKKHSLFTYFFLKGLQGEADINKDGRITAGEMKAYLGENVPYEARRLSRIEQKPVVFGNDGDVIVTLKR